MDPVHKKSHLLILAAVVAGLAVFAIPRIPGSLGGFALADPNAEEAGVTPVDDGYFAKGFDAIALPHDAARGTDSSGTTSPTSGLAASLESALARLERNSGAPPPARAPRTEPPTTSLGSSPQPDEEALGTRSPEPLSTATPAIESAVAASPSTTESPVASPPDPRIEERCRLARWLEKVPLRGSILGASGATLLVDGRRLAVGDALGAGAWIVARIEATTVDFSSGALRVRVGLRDRRAPPTEGAPTPPPTEAREELP